jgi:transposase
MATTRVTIPMQNQILELHKQGKSDRAIARIVGKNRRTVTRIIERGEAVLPNAEVPAWAQIVDWEKVRLEVSKGVQLNILAREHAEGTISYVQFWRQFHKKYPDLPTVTMRLDHKPGERMYFDYTEGVDVVDRDTGEIKTTQLMCGVLAMSSYTFGEFTWTQKRGDLTRSMENAFRFFGGVTPYVTVDNQKAAVDKAHWYDPDVNPTFVDFANHWGFAVIPARPYRPRDKGANESGIGVVQKQFYQEVRDQKFYSLIELNSAFRKYLERLNTAVMKDWGVSRLDRFEGERALLNACPNENWEQSEWRKAKVHADCHVQVLKKFYSVPYQYVGREVRVRVTSKLIEIFDHDLKSLASHARLLGRETHSTDQRHYPAEKVAMTQFSVQLALREAAKVGVETERLVQELLGGAFPLKYLRRVQGLLRLYQSARVTKLALEHAAKMAMQFNKLHLSYVQNAAEYFDRNGNRPTVVRSAPQREPDQMYLHNQSPIVGQET